MVKQLASRATLGFNQTAPLQHSIVFLVCLELRIQSDLDFAQHARLVQRARTWERSIALTAWVDNTRTLRAFPRVSRALPTRMRCTSRQECKLARGAPPRHQVSRIRTTASLHRSRNESVVERRPAMLLLKS